MAKRLSRHDVEVESGDGFVRESSRPDWSGTPLTDA